MHTHPSPEGPSIRYKPLIQAFCTVYTTIIVTGWCASSGHQGG